ncbi:FHA domain-containing protein [Hyalangium rubrum]|uniref:FHA domain-containing protein n=1 Tax=Hyalangium rubrum TaxID=3103134 RepID=A0ABU5GVP7_9BACT|nr:FHA domain-containing protein [Hyalangium sp. s54d21]MDY7225258.1 FHA domain-containing protein [Hyalangium sp. s54d21]
MRFEFEHLGTTTPFELAEGQHLLGGGAEDQVRLEGLPPGFLSLCIEGVRLTVAAAQNFTVNDVHVPRGVPRLVLPGEVVGLPEQMRLKVLQAPHSGERGVGTMAVLKNLLTDGADLSSSRAATLTCLTGLDVGRTFVLAEAQTDLGRGTGVDFRLRDRAVSRSHARILRQGTTFTVLDLGSPNGVFRNGQRVKGSADLAEGDVIELGKTILRFQAPVEVEEPALLPEPALEAPAVEPEPTPRGEWWFIGLGAATALAGVLVTYALVG